MIRHFAHGILVASLALAIGCASKKKGEDGAAGGDASISAEAMNFNSAGSDSGQIAGLSTINFAYDSATLSADARAKLKDNAEWLRTNKSVTLQVEGHCDSRGSVEYNLALGERRAKTVKDYLVGLGVEAKRLSVISYGKE